MYVWIGRYGRYGCIGVYVESIGSVMIEIERVGVYVS